MANKRQKFAYYDGDCADILRQLTRKRRTTREQRTKGNSLLIIMEIVLTSNANEKTANNERTANVLTTNVN